MTYSIVLAGGGTAGHVNPLIATAKELASSGAKVSAVGTAGGLETELVPAAGIELDLIERVPFPRRPNKALFTFPGNFRKALKQARAILESRKADAVVGFGGYASTPMYLAARKMGIPVIVHEANARPGMANKLASRWAHTVALTFPSTPLKAKYGKTVTVGLPMRAQIADLTAQTGGRTTNCAAILERFGLATEKPTLVVTGGSSGAQHINEVLTEAAPALIDAGLQVLHITGKEKDGPVRAGTANLDGYQVLDYLTTMEDAYAIADLIITRSGAGMVAEVSALGIPAVFVPLPLGNGEQALNAHDVVAAGGAILVTNKDFTASWVKENIPDLLGKLEKMAASAQRVSSLTAARDLSVLILQAATEGGLQ